jgi:uncharacterized membrane protein YhaH (DUF805 family)
MKHLVLAGRLVFGAWLLVAGTNHFFVSLYPESTGHEVLGMQLMEALVHSRLFDVAMAVQLVTGLLILGGVFVPLALCLAMPISVCALYWSVLLEHQPLEAVLGCAAFALNGLLMLAYVDYYRGVLQRRALTLGEREGDVMRYETLFVDFNGRTSRGEFVGALIPLVAAAAFYCFLVKGRTGEWVLVMLLFPATVLHARRLHDMSQTAWLLLIPIALNATAISLHMNSRAQPLVSLTALAVSAGFLLWGVAGKGQARANRFGKATTGTLPGKITET